MTRPPIVGRRIDELPTPLLLLDLDALDANIERMARFAAEHGVAVRPHVKNLRSIDIARRQVAAGAIGVTAATVRDARAMLDAGIPEVLLAAQVVGAEQLDVLLGDLPTGSRPILAVDTADGTAAVAAAAERAGIRLDVVLELDVGMGRGGTRDVAASLALADAIAGQPALRLVGVMGYEGHTVLERDPVLRAAGARAATAVVGEHVTALRTAGHDIRIVAAGGTTTHATTALDPVVTELQVGTYAAIDVAYAAFAPGYGPTLSVIAQVVSRHGDTVVLDAGGKTFGYSDLALPHPADGAITVLRLNDEHLIGEVPPGTAGPAIGDRVRLDVASAALAVLMAVQFTVVQGGRVVDVWPIIGRRPDPTTVLPGSEPMP